MQMAIAIQVAVVRHQSRNWPSRRRHRKYVLFVSVAILDFVDYRHSLCHVRSKFFDVNRCFRSTLYCALP